MPGIDLVRSQAVARWTGLHVGLVVLLGFASKALPAWLAVAAKSPDQQPDELLSTPFLLWGAAASLLFVAGTWLLLRTTTSATNADLGWQAKYWWRDIRAGVLIFLLVAVPLYGLQFLLMQFFPQKHPLLEQALSGRDFGFFWAGCLQAIVAAPLSEELLFRVVLQGWMADRFRELFDGDSATAPQPESLAGSGPAATDAADPRPVYWPAIVATSLLFALLHLGQGPAPIPLFFFAIVLGYLYERTRRLLPVLVLHACLNGVTMLQLGLLLLQPPE